MATHEIHTEEYWRDQFDISPDEEVELQEMFMGAGRPLATAELATYLMEQQLTPAGRRRAGDQRYHPSLSYEVGDEIGFPTFDGAVGKVLSIRPGDNPRYQPFSVIEVALEGEREPRLFASDFADLDGKYVGEESGDGEEVEPTQIIERYRHHVEAQIEQVLEGENFVRVGKRWVPRVMLVGLNEGHAHLAEAMIEILGEPLGAADLLPEMPITEEATEELLGFSLDYLLSQDRRFLNVSTNGAARWMLKRLS